MLQDFYVAVTRKIRKPLPPDLAVALMDEYRLFPMVPADYPLIVSAAELSLRYGISYWDGAIIAAAEVLEAGTLYTEGPEPRAALRTRPRRQPIPRLVNDSRGGCVVGDMAEIQQRKRAYRDTAFPEPKDVVLINVVPERIDVANYRRCAVSNPETCPAPAVEFTTTRTITNKR